MSRWVFEAIPIMMGMVVARMECNGWHRIAAQPLPPHHPIMTHAASMTTAILLYHLMTRHN